MLAEPEPPPLIGYAEPLYYTKPLRPLTRETTRGFEVIDFARDVVGMPLLPWQEFAVLSAFELLPNGRYRFRTILIVVARQNGKSHLKRIVTLWRMYMDGAEYILGTAQLVATARKQWKLCQKAIKASPQLMAEWQGVRNVNGDEMFWAGPVPAEYYIKAANEDAARGDSNDEVTIDELRAQRDWKAWSAISKTTNARRNGQVWTMSNAGDDTSVVLNQLQEVGRNGTEPTLCLLEWSAPDGCELDDTEAWRHANPGLGHVLYEEAIRASLGVDTPEVFRTEILCQRVKALDAAIDPGAWKACADKNGTMDGLRDRLALVVDTADGGHTTAAVAGQLDDGRVRVEILAAWADPTSALDDLPDLVKLVRPRAMGWYARGPAAAIGPGLRKLATDVNRRGNRKRRPGDPPEDGVISGQREAEACMGLAELVSARRLLHPDDDLLNAHAGAAQKTPSGDGWRFTRRPPRKGAPPMPVDAATAAAGAAELALTLPVPRTGRIRVLSA